MLKLAIDIGGTFTDVVAETEHGLSSIKVLTSPSSPETAALAGVTELLASLSARFRDIDRLVHGTTLATNALIERRGAKTALITTGGFRDVLEMRNEKRFDQYELNIELPSPLVERPLRIGIEERTLATGQITKYPNDAEIDSVCQHLLNNHVEAVAIGFLHSYRNSANEQHVAMRLQQGLGDRITVCQSAEVAGEIREFERFSTACANAYVRPLMTTYIERLENVLSQRGFRGSFLMMLSDGALTTTEQAKQFPIRLVEGGPAGGVALGAHVAKDVLSDKTLSLDIGGTTAKICFIENGQPQIARRFEVARAWRDAKGSGLPVNVPTIEMVEIGAGGGSIASSDSLGRLKTGPQSAGSDPGPASYNRGGQAPTVTDAHVVTGSIVAEGFAGGKINLLPQNATDALVKDIQRPLGFNNVADAAAGVIELANETMANAARVHGIELGLDVSSFDLLVSGGGGGLHATRIAEKLGISRIIVPEHAGVGSAVGFLRSPIAFESALSVMQMIHKLDYALWEQRLGDAMEYVHRVVSGAIAANQINTIVVAEMRYYGQGLELREPLKQSGYLKTQIIEAKKKFIDQYRGLFGFTLNDIPVELVSLSVRAQQKPECTNKQSYSPPNEFDLNSADGTAYNPQSASGSGCTNTNNTASGLNKKSIKRHSENKVSQREVFDHDDKAFRTSSVIRREALNGDILVGPVIVTEAQTSTVVPKTWSVCRSNLGHLILEKHQP